MTVRSYLFPDAQRAVGFAQDVLESINEDGTVDWGGGPQPQGSHRGHIVGQRADAAGSGALNLPIGFLDEKMSRFNGWPHRSHEGRERFLYGHQEMVFAQDRLYLHKRDDLVKGLIDEPAHDTWAEMPKTRDEEINDFLFELWSMGFPQKAEAADRVQRRDGGAFVYLNASGDPSQPLDENTVWHSFDYVTVFDIVENSIEYDPNPTDFTELHGIERCKIRRNLSPFTTGDPDEADLDTLEVHGSRLIPFIEDVEARWWFGQAKLDASFDSIMGLRDAVYAQRNAQLQGDPFKVTLDFENVGLAALHDDELDTRVEEAIEDFESGQRDSFVLLEGVQIDRVGAQDLPDPEPLARMYASRLGMNWEHMPNEILMIARGSRQVEPEDRRGYVDNIRRRQESYVRPILQHLLKLAQFGKKRHPRRRLVLKEIDWPELQTLGERDQAVADNRDAQTLNLAKALGRRAPRQEEKFPEDPDGPDPDALALMAGGGARASVDKAIDARVRRILEEREEDEEDSQAFVVVEET